MKSYIYGASDDLIEIEGGFEDEIGCYDPKGNYLGCSDGTLLEVDYDGEWKFRCKKAGSMFSGIIQVNDEVNRADELKKFSDYSDIVVFNGAIEWVVIGTGAKK